MNIPLNYHVDHCGRMPEALASICSEEHMPQLSAEIRASIQKLVKSIEGSGPGKGMTCLAQSDYPKVAKLLAFGYRRGDLNDDTPRGFHGFLWNYLRSRNRHCDECIRQDCENQVAMTRFELMERGLSSRDVKTDHEYAGKALRPSHDY